MLPANQYVEVHNGAYYVTGTRIGLDVVTYDFQRGRSAEAIFEAYPSIGSLAKVYGAITFILEHPAEVEAYLKDQDRIFEEIKSQHDRCFIALDSTSIVPSGHPAGKRSICQPNVRKSFDLRLFFGGWAVASGPKELSRSFPEL